VVNATAARALGSAAVSIASCMWAYQPGSPALASASRHSTSNRSGSPVGGSASARHSSTAADSGAPLGAARARLGEAVDGP
jgi:hypothetical protein